MEKWIQDQPKNMRLSTALLPLQQSQKQTVFTYKAHN